MHRCYSAEVIIYLFSILRWSATLYPQVWQVVLSNIPITSRIVHSYVHGLFHCTGHIVSLPAYDFEVFHRVCLASVALVLKNW